MGFSIHHIGSTAVRQMIAKPIIDMMIVARSSAENQLLEFELPKLGYVSIGENGIAGRSMFIKEVNGERTTHIHAYPRNHVEISKHLDFRDALRGDKKIATDYCDLKMNLASQHPSDIDQYAVNKSEFIERTLRSYRNKNYPHYRQQ